MTRKTIVEDFLQKLSSDLHIEGAVKDEQTNLFTIRIGMHTMIVEELTPGFSLWSSIAHLPDGDKEDLYLHLMQANFLGQGTGGGSIGIDQEEKSLTLSLCIPYEVKYEAFKEHVEDFLNYVEYWREQIEAYQNKSSMM